MTAYDPFGRRVGITVNGVVTSYVYDGQDIAASFSGGATTHFVHGPGVDEHLALVQGGLLILSTWTDSSTFQVDMLPVQGYAKGVTLGG